jgi:hypothetical protein
MDDMAIQKKHTTGATRRPPILRMAAVVFVAVTVGVTLGGCGTTQAAPESPQPAATTARPATVEIPYDEQIQSNAKRMLEEGKRIFRNGLDRRQVAGSALLSTRDAGAEGARREL